jgi:hypothetical protein
VISGYEEKMSMGNSPAAGVKKDKVRFKGLHHFISNDFGNLEDAYIFFIGQFMPPGNVSFGDDQAMSLCIGMNIQNAQG